MSDGEAGRTSEGERTVGISWRWPAFEQLGRRDAQAAGEVSFTQASLELEPRTRGARKVRSVCPYCAVGCGQLVFLDDDGSIIDIEGDPDSPISKGCLCPKGAATYQLVTGSHRATKVLYRRPRGTQWEEIDLDRAMDMVAQRVKATRDATFIETDERGRTLNHTLGFAHLGGATLDNEENYLIKKLFTALGAVQIENQARI